MDMYGYVKGEFGRVRREKHADDALNYFLRALHFIGVSAKALGDEEVCSEMRAEAAKLEARMQAHDAG
jgi:hypothetical protein